MEYEKGCIKNNEWLFFLPFFIISVLVGKLLVMNVAEKSSLLNKTVTGLEWLFCILLMIGVGYEFYKLIKREYVLEKIWLFSGIFILFQFAGVYQFELLMKYYNLGLNNVLFHDIMLSYAFAVPYTIFLMYYIINGKNGKAEYGLTKGNTAMLLLMLLLPIIRSINLFIYKSVVEGLQSNRISLISRIIFDEHMRYSEKAKIAENVMNLLVLINTYIDFFYYFLLFGINGVLGIRLFGKKITCQKYLALGGTFISTQYLGIVYFDKILNYFDNSFYTSNLNLLYKIVLNYSQPLVFIIPLILYFFKKSIVKCLTRLKDNVRHKF